MKITDKIEMLEIKRPPQSALYPVLAWDDKDVVLIDTGMPGFMPLFTDAIKKAGFLPKDITKVILTHQDIDHIGCAKEFQQLGAQILTHETEAPYIEGSKKFLKIDAMEKRFNSLSPAERGFYEQLQQAVPSLFVKVDKKLRDKEVLPYCGGIEVIHTPGHTLGHISLLFKAKSVLVTGDAANIKDGVFSGANPQHTFDMAEAEKSFAKLKQYNAKYIITYHCGLVK